MTGEAITFGSVPEPQKIFYLVQASCTESLMAQTTQVHMWGLGQDPTLWVRIICGACLKPAEESRPYHVKAKDCPLADSSGGTTPALLLGHERPEEVTRAATENGHRRLMDAAGLLRSGGCSKGKL